MDTQDLFNDTKSMARKTDPESSHLAAEAMVKEGGQAFQQNLCLDAVAKWPGMTSREYAERLLSDRYMFSRRLPELERKRLVHRARQPDGKFVLRKCVVGNKMSCIWFPGEHPFETN